MSKFSKNLFLISGFIFLAELASIFGYLLPDFRQIAFFVIAGLVLILSLVDLKYGLYFVLAELFIGSKGYLFYYEHAGLLFSIRIALWLIVMAVWLGGVIFCRREKSQFIDKGDRGTKFPIGNLVPYKNSDYFKYFSVLFLFILWGFVNSFLNHNGFADTFFDFNGWLYFALIFPIYSVFKSKENQEMLWQIFLASILWLALKTFFLLFVFSHNMIGMVYELYGWVRTTGVGEITRMQGGFHRIFFQSHIFILTSFFIFLMLLTSLILKDKKESNKKFLTSYFLILTLLLFVIIITFSRSFWVGLVFGLLVYWFVSLLVLKIGWKNFFKVNGLWLASLIISVGLIAAVVKFPYPNPLGGFSTADLLSKRLSQQDEAAISSRWALLPQLWQEIKSAPVLGRGFGATVTYKTQDPRALELNPGGKYTTYAFEWGWLDIWLKLGFFGLLAYLALIFKLMINGLQSRNNFAIGLALGLLAISATSFFSPYLNHPLGIGYLMVMAAIFDNKNGVLH
ncbi:hypothetical protein COV49_01935 [Candidatus Falkowbacteria bacterium CG11_big_fil_rev_8_21_14_0_20_39_10]|uniref:O-antigen ligase-related domain-containing protein n=1 Tax=Candidatus Falkowbacteria bacterium CG11_big_fil_rev_8_21_14_0_20_39_10 TaxID=1974570 RepID=A0A2M6K9D7_9BACT|nr:MAG: hypothetical protein COV49_01935 [Candidatus Falkowbacteria bacterium CG11_big_fil_rev_8_21_14_0_20_39_10]